MLSLFKRLQTGGLTKLIGAITLATVFTVSARAIPISGSIAFGGSAKLNVPSTQIANATGVASITWGYVSPNQQFGDFASIPNFTSVNFTTPFLFTDSGVTPLWSLTSGGKTYSFTATSITATYYSAYKVWNIGGYGYASITGFENTGGSWNMAVGAQGSSFFFGSAAVVPDGGSTVLILGISLISASMVARRRVFGRS